MMTEGTGDDDMRVLVDRSSERSTVSLPRPLQVGGVGGDTEGSGRDRGRMCSSLNPLALNFLPPSDGCRLLCRLVRDPRGATDDSPGLLLAAEGIARGGGR